MMTAEQFDSAFERGDLYDAYVDFIYKQGTITNGEAVIVALEEATYYEAFRESMIDWWN